MKEHPILFSDPMVLAIMEGRKTMTRRVAKNPFENYRDWPKIHANGDVATIECHYGQPGDRLWVREAWTNIGDPIRDGGVIYRADPMFDGCSKGDIAWKWKPSIFMPRWASRIILEIVSVRAERVQDISERDAKAEGVEPINWGALQQLPMSLTDGIGSPMPGPYRCGFYKLWDAINASRGYAWDNNPWVWVIEFKRIDGSKQ